MKKISIQNSLLLLLFMSFTLLRAHHPVNSTRDADRILRDDNIFTFVENPALSDQQSHYFKGLDIRPKDKYSFVRINVPLLKAGQPITLNLPGSKTVRLTNPTREEWLNGRIIWRATSLEAANWTTFIINGDLITGDIRLEDEDYQLSPLGEGLSVLLSIVNRDDDQCGTHEDASQGRGSRQNKPQKLTPDDDDYYDAQFSAPAEECNVRLLFAYTNAADDASADILSRIRLDVDNFNQVNENSEVDFEVELACVVQVNYTESNASQHVTGYGTKPTDLVRFWDPNDGFMDAIHELRNLYDADLCQIYVASGPPGVALTIGADASEAFCLSRWNTGGNFTPIHEFGHLFGMRHDIATDPNLLPFHFGHGYVWFGDGPNFRTVMAYGQPCEDAGTVCHRIRQWSNPNVSVAGTPTGNYLANNARVARLRDQTVGGFQSTINNKSLFRDDIIRVRELATVQANQTISTANHTIDYRNGSFGEYSAAERISLLPGFRARSGSSFRAHLVPVCTPLNLQSPITDQVPEQRTDAEKNVVQPSREKNPFDLESAGISAFEVAPNPFGDRTVLTFRLSKPGRVMLKIMDLNGVLISTLVDGKPYDAGDHQVEFDAYSIPSGMYVAHLVTETDSKVIQIIRSK